MQLPIYHSTNCYIIAPILIIMDKIFTYDNLPDKEDRDDSLKYIQFTLTDDVILDYLNRITKDSNKLVSITYKEVSVRDKIGEIQITFTLVKEYPK